MVLQWAQWHVLVDEDPLIAIGAVAEQLDKIGMMQETQHEDLDKEFTVALESISVKLLDCDDL